jgi:lipoprotein-releasing system permease protein
LKFELFLAKKTIFSQEENSRVTRPIVRIAVAAVALSFLVMLISVATGTGLQKEIKEKVIGFDGHIKVTHFDFNNSFESTAMHHSKMVVEAIRKVKGVKDVQPFATKACIVRSASDFEGILLKGVDSSYTWQFFENKMLRGKIPELQGEETKDQLLISAIQAARLGVDTGSKVVLYFAQEPPKSPRRIPFFVSGIYDSGLEDFDKLYAMADITHILKLNGWGDSLIGGYEVLLEDIDRIPEANTRINELLPYNQVARTVGQNNPQIFEWLALFDLNMLIILVVMILVSSINMITTLLILIIDRRQFIGVLKALGSPDGMVRKVFLYHATYLIGLGLLIGNVVGIGFCLGQKHFGWIKLDPLTYYVDTAPINLVWWHVVALNVGTLLVCLLILVVPSYLISRISPTKVLRFN